MKMLNVIALLGLLLVNGCATGTPPPESPLDIAELNLRGDIDGENIAFSLGFTADVHRADAKLTLVRGDVGALESSLPRGVELAREGAAYNIAFKRDGAQNVAMKFASAAVACNDDWRETRFSLPQATLRRVVIHCDRPDVDVRFTDALRTDDKIGADGKREVTALLAAGRDFAVQWKPQVRKLTGELVVSCDASTIAAARVGALQVDSVFTYRVVQGSLQKLTMEIPDSLNVTQVRGADLREWNIAKSTNGNARLLTVSLSRPQEKQYVLDVEGEVVLPAFPAAFDFPVAAPRDVIRASGFLLVGADGAIRLTVDRAAGLTQIDPAAFPATTTDGATPRAVPVRSVFAWQYANMPFQMKLSADDIVTQLQAEDRLVLGLEDVSLSLAAAIDLDIRDAPVREIVIATDPAWTVASVSGAEVVDHDVRDADGKRQIRVSFKQGVLGHTLVEARLERALPDSAGKFDVPAFSVQGARSERGYLVLYGEAGVRLEPGDTKELREVNTGSLPVHVNGAQRAFRFKNAGWTLPVAVVTESPAIHAEIFHLVSLGEGSLYGSASITYNIGSAPVRSFKLRIPAAYRNIEITGRDVRGWQQSNEVWTVAMQEKVSGDYTLLVTYTQPLTNGTSVLAGGIEALGVESESGYIAVAGAARMAFDRELKRDASVLPVAPEEVPAEYAALIRDPVLRAYKYVRAPHQAQLAIKAFDTSTMPGQVADHLTLLTKLSEDGEAVTEAAYFVKNTSGQYLGLKIPTGANLWSASVDGKSVQVLQEKEGSVLVPVERRRDPNQPSCVKLVYAEQFGKMKFWRSFPFRAPEAAARSIFASWTFELPEKARLLSTGGNMMPPPAPTAGLAAVVADAGRIYSLFFQGRPWRPTAPPVVRGVEFTKPVTLSEGGLEASLSLAPRWLVTTGDVVIAFVSLLAAVIVMKILRHRNQPRFALAVALTIVIWVAAQIPEAAPWCSIFIAAIPLFVLIGLTIRAICALRRKISAARTERLARAADIIRSQRLESDRDSDENNSHFSDKIPPVPPPPPEPQAGFVSLRLLGLVALAAAGIFAFAARGSSPMSKDWKNTDREFPSIGSRVDFCEAKIAPPVVAKQKANVQTIAADEGVIAKSVAIAVEAPDTAKDLTIRNAKVTETVEMDIPKGGRVMLLPAGFVLDQYKLDGRGLSVSSGQDGVFVKSERGGLCSVTVTYFAGVAETDGAWHTQLWLPPNVKNSSRLKIPGTGWDVTCAQSVALHAAENAGATEAQIVLGPADHADLVWRPLERKTAKEQAAFFCDISTYALFQPGLVNLTHLIRYQIAQGEVQSLELDIPEGMSVTAVTGAGLNTWRFDPEKHRLEALLEKPVSGDYTLAVVEQTPRDSLPYDVTIREPTVRGASLQRGTIAMAATEAVQLRVGDATGLSAMNNADFAANAVDAGMRQNKQAGPAEIKRAFRYHQLPVCATVSVDRVLAELRVQEDAGVDITDERIQLTSRIALAISRAGIFSTRLDIPAGFDMDSLTGDDVSHWDEIKDETGRGITVHFTKQALGNRTLNLVLSQPVRGVASAITLPRLTVRDALKHTGTLVVSGERGIRLTTQTRVGVSEINPRELGIEQPGYLAYRLLRPDWNVALQTEVMAPVVKAEVLQRADVSEGMLSFHAWLQYGIEHAGVKTFRFRAPAPGMALAAVGKNIARVQETDATNGIWEIELHGKAEQAFAVEVTGQRPFEHGTNLVRIASLQTLGTESQKGWLAIFAGGRLRVQAAGAAGEGMQPDDPRGIPTRFNAGDFSGAVLCYRTSRPDWTVDVAVARHDAADLLPARVQSVRLTSVVSDDDQRATRAVVTLDPGTKRFLRMKLPAGSELWSVFVNDRPVAPLLDGNDHLIPLESAGGANTLAVECLYGEPRAAGGESSSRHYEGPKFDLPLSDVTWDFYLPQQYRYSGFDGTLRHQEDIPELVAIYDTQSYASLNASAVQDNIRKAEQVLQKGDSMRKAGKQVEARQALEDALLYSQGQQALNEDARVQYNSLLRQQAVVGLANRRATLKAGRNAADSSEVAQIQGFNGGNWNAAYGQRVEQNLGAKESDSLNILADKLIEQQSAAVADVHPIRVTLPLQGRHLAFARALQIQPDADLVVTFRVSDGSIVHAAWTLLAGIGLLMLAGIGARLSFGREGALM